MPPSAMTGTPALLARLRRLEHRRKLRHADAGDDAGGADRAGADADLDRVGARVDQRLRALARGDVAGDDRDLVGRALDAAHLLEHVLGMAVRGVDDEAIDARRHQQFGALEALVADGRRGGDAQAPVGVLGGVGMGGRLLDVLDGDEADAFAVLVDDDQLFDAMLVQQAARLVACETPSPDRDDLRVISSADRLARIVGETHVAVGEDADQPARLAVGAALDHGNAGDRGALHQRQRVGERRVGENGDRVDHHAALEALDLAHLFGLLLGREIAVDDADAARLRHGDGEPRLGDGVHRRGKNRQIEADRARQPRRKVDAARHDRRMAGPQQHVVEREALGNGEFVGDGHRPILSNRASPSAASRWRVRVARVCDNSQSGLWAERRECSPRPLRYTRDLTCGEIAKSQIAALSLR